PVFTLEPPEHQSMGTARREVAAGGPCHGTYFGGIAGHPEFLAVGEPPGMEGGFLHGGHQIFAVRAKADVEMRAFPLERLGWRRRVRKPEADPLVACNCQ